MCITQTNEQVTRLYDSFEKMRQESEEQEPKINLADINYHGDNIQELELKKWEL